MAKKTKDENIDLLYINKNENKSYIKKKNNNLPKDKKPQNDIIDLDKEIIIGLTTKKNNDKTNAKSLRTSPNRPVNNNSKVGNAGNKVGKDNSKSNIHKNKKTNKKRVVIIKWTSLMILLIGIIVLTLLSPLFNIEKICVNGIQKLSDEEIISLSQIKLEENIFKMKKANIIENIKKNAYVEDVKVNRVLPGTINITIQERTPQYIIQIANGNAYISSKGYILEISTESLELPILYGYETSIEDIVNFEETKKLSNEDCKRIEIANQVIDAASKNNILSYITSINIEDIYNIKLNLDSEGKVAYLGNCTDANLRILYLKTMIEKEGGKAGEAFINGDIHTLKPKPYFREKI